MLKYYFTNLSKNYRMETPKNTGELNDAERQEKKTPASSRPAQDPAYSEDPMGSPADTQADALDEAYDGILVPLQEARQPPMEHLVQPRRSIEGTRSTRTALSYSQQAKPYLTAFTKALYPDACAKNPMELITLRDILSFPRWFAATYRQRPWSRQNLQRVKISLIYVLWPFLPAEGLEALRTFKPSTVTRRGTKSSALRERNPTPEQIKGILFYLDHLGTTMGNVAASWFRAQYVAGLRPKEWLYASYLEDGDMGILAVPNGKQNCMLAQGTGAERHMLFSGAEQAVYRQALRTFFTLMEELFSRCEQAKGWSREESFRFMYTKCCELYRQANNYLRCGGRVSLKEKNLCLYSLRHAFKADLACQQGREANRPDTAALMGHGSAQSQDMYAPRGKGTGRRYLPSSFEKEQRLVRTKGQRRAPVHQDMQEGAPHAHSFLQPQAAEPALREAFGEASPSPDFQ